MRAIHRRAKIEVRVVANQHVVRPARRHLKNGRNCEFGEELFPEALVTLAVRAHESSTGNPTVSLVEIGIAALTVRIVVVLGVQQRRKISRIASGQLSTCRLCAEK
jgi:hypothetical protein